MIVDPNLDLVLARQTDVPPEKIWRAWTEAKHLKQWFAPRPWTVDECGVELRVGGRFRVVMRSPEGQLYPSNGCYLEIVENQRLVWTDALAPGYRPSVEPFFTAAILLEGDGRGGTKYKAIAMHKDPEGCEKHEKMGFVQGWSQVFDQLVEHAKTAL